MNHTKINYIYKFLMFFFVLGCTSQKDENRFEIGCYQCHYQTGCQEIEVLKEDEIKEVNWEVNSYSLKDSAVTKLKDSGFTSGYLSEFFEFRFKGKSLGKIRIYNIYSASTHILVQDIKNYIKTDNENNSFIDDSQRFKIIVSEQDSINLKNEELRVHFLNINLIQNL